MIMDSMSSSIAASDRRAARNIEVLSAWAGQEALTKPRHLDIRFLTRPIEILGADRVEGIRVERTRYDDTGNLVSTGVTTVISTDFVIHSVGYRSDTLKGVAFDQRLGTVRNDAGRILSDTAEVIKGEFTAGWLKRGPTGIIGTNKIDAKETVETILADIPQLPVAPITPEAFERTLTSRGVPLVLYKGWQEIDKAETSLGQSSGRDRTTIHERDVLVKLGRQIDIDE
jgi:ferredoxin--NADP+ reductase